MAVLTGLSDEPLENGSSTAAGAVSVCSLGVLVGEWVAEWQAVNRERRGSRGAVWRGNDLQKPG